MNNQYTRYSDYTIEQLRIELLKLKEQALKAEQQGNMSEVAVNERKMAMVRAYMMNPNDFNPGDSYEMMGDPGHHYKITYLDGIMAWGHRINLLGEMYEKEEAIPISILGEKIKQ